MQTEVRILYLEDKAADAVLVNHELRRAGIAFLAKRVDDQESFRRELGEDPPDVILSDHGLPSFDGFSALALAQQQCPDVPFLFVTDALGDETALRTLESGAVGYVLKRDLSKLGPALQRVLDAAQERTRRRLQHEALRRSEEDQRRLLEVCPAANFVILSGGEIAQVNPAGVSLLRAVSAVELIGKPMPNRFGPGRWEELLDQVHRRREGGVAPSFHQEQLLGLDGQGVSAEICLVPVRFREHAALQLIAHATREDAAEANRSESEQRRPSMRTPADQESMHAAELAGRQEDWDTVANCLAHELRAPLRRVSGYAGILGADEGLLLDERAHGHLFTIAETAHTLQAQLDALAAFLRLGRVRMQPRAVSLAALVDEARRRLQHDTAARQFEWALGDIPDVQGDPELLQQAVQHLLANAVKFTRTRPLARIAIEARRTRAETVLTVRDNGVGFDMRQAGKLFRLFQRLHSSPDFRGLGVGLASVQRIAQRHGGRVWGAGEVDTGAAFSMALPRL